MQPLEIYALGRVLIVVLPVVVLVGIAIWWFGRRMERLNMPTKKGFEVNFADQNSATAKKENDHG